MKRKHDFLHGRKQFRRTRWRYLSDALSYASPLCHLARRRLASRRKWSVTCSIRKIIFFDTARRTYFSYKTGHTAPSCYVVRHIPQLPLFCNFLGGLAKRKLMKRQATTTSVVESPCLWTEPYSILYPAWFITFLTHEHYLRNCKHRNYWIRLSMMWRIIQINEGVIPRIEGRGGYERNCFSHQL